MIPVNAPMVRLQGLGEHTRLVVAGTFIGHDTAAACEEAVDVECVSSARDFVFDLSRVGRHDTGALRSIADLWRRLHGLGCAGVVAAANPAVCLTRDPGPLEVHAAAHAGRGAHPSIREPRLRRRSDRAYPQSHRAEARFRARLDPRNRASESPPSPCHNRTGGGYRRIGVSRGTTTLR
jgi:anti-anti-sigma regulatory factor